MKQPSETKFSIPEIPKGLVITDMEKFFQNPKTYIEDAPPVNGDSEYIHSEEIEEIISKVPSWVLKYGITIFLLILGVILTATSMIPIPDSVSAAMDMELLNAPVKIRFKKPTIIEKVLVANKQTVHVGDPLLVIGTNSIWKPKDTVKAIKSGTIFNIHQIQPGALQKENVSLLLIRPSDTISLGRMLVSEPFYFKIKLGQDVLVSFKGIPANLLGKVKGTVNWIAEEPDDAGYFEVLVKLKFETGKANQAKTWMKAQATIITSETTIFNKIFRTAFRHVSISA